jgi:hypothetical protein
MAEFELRSLVLQCKTRQYCSIKLHKRILQLHEIICGQVNVHYTVYTVHGLVDNHVFALAREQRGHNHLAGTDKQQL